MKIRVLCAQFKVMQETAKNECELHLWRSLFVMVLTQLFIGFGEDFHYHTYSVITPDSHHSIFHLWLTGSEVSGNQLFD